MALPAAPTRIDAVGPSRSAVRPSTAEDTAAAAKNAPTARPSPDSPKPRSARSCTLTPPVRKAGRAPPVTTAMTDARGRHDPHRVAAHRRGSRAAANGSSTAGVCGTGR